jgi:type IV secretory pathway VirB2 component (pilin)
MIRYSHHLRTAAAFGIVFLMATGAAHASSTVSQFDTPMQNLQAFLTGTPTKIISIIAIVVAGIALIFGEDLGVFAKRLLMVVIATAMIAGSASIAGNLFQGSGSGLLIP